MKYGEFLSPGGTIGFVAPSFGCSDYAYRTGFANALRRWGEMGYRLTLGPNCFESSGTGISNTPSACAQEFNEFYLGGNNDCLISCGGGELMCEILDFVDFDAIREARPKWFMGFSDNTNLTYLLATLCDTAAIYGPCAASFGMEPWHRSLYDAMEILTGKRTSVSGYPLWERESFKNDGHPLAPYNLTEPTVLTCCRGRGEREPLVEPIEMEGRLIGGCMDCLVNLVGTKYDRTEQFLEKYREDGFIWFLEACDLNPFAVRRAMWQMDHAGWFQYVKGFLIGRPGCIGQELMGLDACSAVLETAGRKGVPVILDLDIGHMKPMMPVVTGGLAHVRGENNGVTLSYRYE